jgi:hypothetical protein
VNPRIGYSRKINIEPKVIDGLRLLAADRGVPVSVLIREALRQYVRRHLRAKRDAA